MKICQTCTLEIKNGEQAIQIKYGIKGESAHPHDLLLRYLDDWFHKGCDIAIR